jgi:tRNA nucleotidyltransferase (CCA-adding enzyme)
VKAYLVGGAVRDKLLGIPYTERDWVVVGATEQEMLDAGFRRADPDAAFPVFLHPETGEEYALARRETKTGAGYRGFAVDAGPDVSLEEDLARRDLTINAMAEDAQGALIDPFHGREDLDQGLLRHVTPAFVEDPVRLLRVARFAAKLGCWGFRVAHGTHALMQRMAATSDLEALRPERVWQEMTRALAEPQPWRFFEVLQRCGALIRLIPELSAVLAVDGGHGKQMRSAALESLQRAAERQLTPPWRLAVLLAAIPGEIDSLLVRLRCDKTHASAVRVLRMLAPLYRQLAGAPPEAWLTFLEQGRAWQQGEAFTQAVTACAVLCADVDANLPARIERARALTVSVDARALQAEGLAGAALGRALRERRLAVLEAALMDSHSETL